MKFPKTQVIALTNQKGGCGKTTSAVSIAAAFHNLGYSVAIVDTDPQANASMNLGITQEYIASNKKFTLIDAFLAKRPAIDIQINLGDRYDNRFHVIPASPGLSSVGNQLKLEVQVQLAQQGLADVEAEELERDQRFRLRKSIESLYGVHDLVIIDTPPNLDFLMTSALVAADWFIIPVFPSAYDLAGLELLTRTINKIRERYNPGLKIAGVLLGSFDRTTKLHSQVHQMLSDKFGENTIFQTTISRGVRMQELTFMGKTVFEHEGAAQQAEQFLSLAKEMINRGSKGQDTTRPIPTIESVLAQSATKPNDFTISEEVLEVGNG